MKEIYEAIRKSWPSIPKFEELAEVDQKKMTADIQQALGDIAAQGLSGDELTACFTCGKALIREAIKAMGRK